eukprot:7856037-Pyramimonas_sp.AAC.1
MALPSLLTPPAVKPAWREKSIHGILLTGTHGIGRGPRARGGAMAAGSAAGGYNPGIHYPYYAGDELQGYWVHHTAIHWMSREHNERRTWHF